VTSRSIAITVRDLVTVTSRSFRWRHRQCIVHSHPHTHTVGGMKWPKSIRAELRPSKRHRGTTHLLIPVDVWRKFTGPFFFNFGYGGAQLFTSSHFLSQAVMLCIRASDSSTQVNAHHRLVSRLISVLFFF
jgi:hypothetical protein